MSELIYKEIEKKDRDKILNLIDNVVSNLERPEFYFIGDEEKEIQRMFDLEYVYNLGVYDNEKLVGMTQLYIDQEDLKEYIDILGLNKYKVCELGSALVLENYRNRGIMQNLIKIQKDKAKHLKFDYMIATVHPENTPSNIVFEKFGFFIEKQIMINDKYLRNLYQIKLG